MPFIPTIVEIRDANGVRVDRPNARNEQQPIVLKLSGGMTAESTDLGDGRTQVTINGGSGVVPEFTGYHGVGTAGKTDVSGLTATTYGALPFAFTASPSDQKVYTAIPVSLGPAALSLDGWGVDTTESVISVSGVDYRLLETVNLLTGTDLTFVVGVSVAAGATGPTGPAGPGYVATSSSLLTFGYGSRTVSTQTDLAYSPGQRVRLVSHVDVTQFMEGEVVWYGGNSLVFTSDLYSGTGTAASWYLCVAGRPGARWFPEVDTATGARIGDMALHTWAPGFTHVFDYDGSTGGYKTGWHQNTTLNLGGATGASGAGGDTGPTGPGYYATSLSSLAIGVGSKTFVTQSGLAYIPRQRVRAVVDEPAPARYMEGEVTSYSGTSLVVLVDRVFGEGTMGVWLIGLAGDVGATGPTGPSYGSLGPWGASEFATGATGDGGTGGAYQVMSPNAMGAPMASGVTGAVNYNTTYLPRACTIKRMVVTLGKTWASSITVVVYVEGSATALTCTLASLDVLGTVVADVAVSYLSAVHIRMYSGTSGADLWAKATLEVSWAT